MRRTYSKMLAIWHNFYKGRAKLGLFIQCIGALYGMSGFVKCNEFALGVVVNALAYWFVLPAIVFVIDESRRSAK